MKAADFLTRTREAYDSSSAFMDSNYRADFDYSLRAFRNEHASGSKYLSDEFKSRSRIFRPKTRSIIRKNEAAAMQAAFSNREMVSTEPGNPDDPMSVASAEALKEVMEYRLHKTLPTFQLYLGGIQDAQTQGAVVSYQYWEYEKDKNGKKKKDKPCIELRPIENMRIDGGANWLDPINTSPYLCDIIPMYVCDVKSMMNKVDDKTGAPKWNKFEDAVIEKARPDIMDTTRRARLGKGQDPHQEPTGIKAFDVVWVMRWFMRDDEGEDFTYYTLGTEELLTDPAPLQEVYFHGIRPYVMGCAILETHKVIKTSMPTLIRPLQMETNDIANQRLDNVKFVLNKRWIVARGRQVDVQSLVRNVPGGVTLATDPKNDVQESNWPDVTSSAYVEQDRINADMDDIAGNFSPSTKVANNAVNDTLGGSRLAAAGAGLMTEYLIRTINETWWEKVINQLALLEQYYETDEVVLAICAKKARLFPRFGLSQITDDMLMNEVTVSVDMSMGDPNQKLQKFVMVTQTAIGLVQNAPPGMNVLENINELYANAGYRSASRFWSEQQDPRIIKLMQIVQQLQGALQGDDRKLQQQGQLEVAKIQSNERINAAKLQVDGFRIQGDLRIRQTELVVEQQRLGLERLKIQMEASGNTDEHRMKLVELDTKIKEAQMKLAAEHAKIHGQTLKLAQDLEKGQQQIQLARDKAQGDERIKKVTDSVSSAMEGVGKEIAELNAALEGMQVGMEGMDDMKSTVAGLGQGVGLLLQDRSASKKPKGFALKKNGNQTTHVSVSYHDGSTEDIPVTVQ